MRITEVSICKYVTYRHQSLSCFKCEKYFFKIQCVLCIKGTLLFKVKETPDMENRGMNIQKEKQWTRNNTDPSACPYSLIRVDQELRGLETHNDYPPVGFLSFKETSSLFPQEVCGLVFTLEPNGAAAVVFAEYGPVSHYTHESWMVAKPNIFGA